MTIISPSILSADFNQLGADCRMVLDAGAQMLHYDVMDGHFVPNISFGVPVLKSLHKALPDAFYDVHLMITRHSTRMESRELTLLARMMSTFLHSISANRSLT